MKPLAAYIRVSKERPEMRSPDHQRNAIQGYADGEGYELEWLPVDRGVSGAKVARRTLEDALRRIEAGELGGLIVYRLSRLSRLPGSERFRLIERIEGAGGMLVSTQEGGNTGSTPEGRMARNMFCDMARMEWERYQEGWALSRKSAIADGAFVGPTPLGYRRPVRGPDDPPSPLEIDPATKDLVCECYRRRVAGASWADLVRYLAEHGVRMTRLGVRAMLRSRVYLGESRHGEFVNPNAHPPLVDAFTWERAQVADPPRTRNGHDAPLLAGVVRCAGCGRGMTQTVTLDRQERPLRSYTCRTPECMDRASIATHLLDPVIEGVVVEHLRGERFRASRRVMVATDAERSLSEAEHELENLRRAAGRLIGVMGEEAYTTTLAEHAERVEVARREVIRTRLPEPLAVDLDWSNLTLPVRRTVIQGGIRAVWCYPGREPVTERVRVQVNDPDIEYPALSRRGTRSDLVTVLRSDDLPGEIRFTDERVPEVAAV